MAIQKLRGARHIIWEMDVYPDIAVDLGVLKRNGLPARIFGWLADLPRRHADRVIVLGECMRSRLIDHGLPAENIYVAEHWADSDALPSRDRSTHSPCSGELSIVYSGNFGRAHDAETIAGAMAELNRPDDGFEFVFGGGGSRQAWMRDFCEQNSIAKARFLPYCERNELKSRLASGDIGLVTQHVDSTGAVVPSKSYGIMAAGRPVLFIGPRQSTTAQMIRRYGCGWQIDCGDVRSLVELLRHLDANRELVLVAGQLAYRAFVSHYQRCLGVSRMAAVLQLGVERKSVLVAQTANCEKQPIAEETGTRTRVAQNG
jgi:glycosyltransferase involved in cell wall biosynthesis